MELLFKLGDGIIPAKFGCRVGGFVIDGGKHLFEVFTMSAVGFGVTESANRGRVRHFGYSNDQQSGQE
jgi:hypothetical protein